MSWAWGPGTAPPAFLTPRRGRSCDLPPGAGGGLASPAGQRRDSLFLQHHPHSPFLSFALAAESKKEGFFLLFLFFFPFPALQPKELPTQFPPALSPQERTAPGLGSQREEWRPPVGVQTLPRPRGNKAFGASHSFSKWEAPAAGEGARGRRFTLSL